jgi:hypothetical protein
MPRTDAASRPFFRSSRVAHEQLTELFDFVWPAATALWNLRWQVAGYASANPNLTQEGLNARFVLGSGIHGVNLRKACFEFGWEQQQFQFAKFLLIDLFALYEAWLETTLKSLNHKSLLKDFQRPSTSGIVGGLAHALAQIRRTESLVIKSAIYPGLLSQRKNSLVRLEAMMTCYRFFKELRNSIIHRGGIADSLVCSAYASFSRLSASDLGIKQLPEHPVPVINQRLSIPLRGVVAFSEIILRLITTLDAELAKTSMAERELLSQWRDINGRGVTLKANPQERRAQLSRLIRKLGMPTPTRVEEIEALLRDNHLLG